MEYIEVSKILPDEGQPRKYFAADKMSALRNSIKKSGIIQPLVVEEMGNGKYLLIDGERRFRSAVELGMKTVPCTIEAPQKETDRLVRQFQIQEQHESWTPIEKAMAISNLAAALKITLTETCKVLGVSGHDTRRYVAFAELADKQAFVRSEVPIEYVRSIRTLTRLAKRLYVEELEKEFTTEDEKRLEHRVTRAIMVDSIKKKNDVVRLCDAFKKNPKLIEKFLRNQGATPDALFVEAKAAGAYHLRNMLYSARYTSTHARQFMETKDIVLEDEQVSCLKSTITALEKVLSLSN